MTDYKKDSLDDKFDEEILLKKIKKSFEENTPAVWDSVLRGIKTQSEDEKGTEIMKEIKNIKKNNISILKKLISVAAAIVVLVGGGIGFSHYNTAHAIDSVVFLDVNPSIEISMNSAERVLKVTPLNKDGEIVIGKMDLGGSNIDVALNAIIGSMLKNGYIDEAKNSILLTVDNKDKNKGEALKLKLTSEIEDMLKMGKVKGAILGQTASKTEEVTKLAKEYGITEGKVQLINEIIAGNNKYSFKDLVSLTINELNLIGTSPRITLPNITSKGKASDKGYIGEDRAKFIAFTHAGTNKDKVTQYEAEMDFEHGIMVYDLEFTVGNIEYSYEINALDGAIVSHEKEGADFDDDGKVHHKKHDKKVKKGSENYISLDSAKSVALNHAGFRGGDIRNYNIHKDNDDGKTVYEISFYKGDTEYEYEIDALTGKILSFDKESGYEDGDAEDAWDDDEYDDR